MKFSLLALALVATAPLARAEEKKANAISPLKLVCHGPHEQRSLEIVTKGTGCTLLYTKQKETKEVAKAQFDPKPCHEAMQKIRDRLESGNFACE